MLGICHSLKLFQPREREVHIRLKTFEILALLGLAAAYALIYALIHDRYPETYRMAVLMMLMASWVIVFIGVLVIAYVRELG